MYYFQKTVGDRLVESTVTSSAALKTYASTYTSGQVAFTFGGIKINLRAFGMVNMMIDKK